VQFQSVGERGWIIVAMKQPYSRIGLAADSSFPAQAFRFHESFLIDRFSLAIAIVGNTKDSS